MRWIRVVYDALISFRLKGAGLVCTLCINENFSFYGVCSVQKQSRERDEWTLHGWRID